MTYTQETNSPEETFSLGERMGEQAETGQVYTLTGDLGTGKTVFTQGFARGLGVTELVNSPTFTILQEYGSGRLPFYHFDVYRIGDIEEMEEIGYEECFYGTGVCLIEWADLITELLPPGHCRITIEKDLEKGFDYRKITVEETGSHGGRGGENRQPRRMRWRKPAATADAVEETGSHGGRGEENRQPRRTR